MASRQERRQLAREGKASFEPQYNTAEGVVTFEEYHGVGIERFNSKQVTIKVVDEESKYYFEGYPAK